MMHYTKPNPRSFFIFLFSLIFSFQISAQFKSEKYELILKNERVVLSENITDREALEIDLNEVIGGKYYRVIQFHSLPSATIKEELVANGISLLEYIPNNAYTVSIREDFDVNKFPQFNIRAIERIPLEWKQDQYVINRNFESWAVDGNKVKLSINYFKDLDKSELLRALEDINAQVILNPESINLLHIKIDLSKINDLLALPHIYFVSQIVGPGTPDDNIGRGMHRNNMINTAYPTGRNYDGTGVKIMVRDDGFVGPHIDFQGRITNEVAVITNAGTHADGVAGMAGAAGNLDPTKAGAARGADMLIVNYNPDFLDETTLNLINNEGVLLTNSSYSNGCNAGYTDITQTVDQQCHDNPNLLHIFSAGNSNNLNCGYGAGDQWGNITGGHKQGKNVIATANLNTVGNLVNSSSHGPAHDGRIKPDIAAHGQNQISTYPNHTYDPFGGTSAAAPCVMGTTAQLYQAYRELNGGEDPEGALIKAILMNTANDLENEGPDFRTGWGHLNAYRAVLLLENNQYTEGFIGQNQILSDYTIDVPANTKQLRVMVYWNDRPASTLTNKALVNDINMSVTTPSGDPEMPWILDPTPDPGLLDLPATKGMDNLNNMEQVLIKNPEAGEHIVNLQGLALPFGNQKYFIVYDIVPEEDITLVYPNGGESFVPDARELIQWDAFSNEDIFTLEYSEDGGAAWISIATVPSESRNYSWDIPATISGNILMRVSRGSISDETDVNFSIGPVPEGLHASQLCPDLIRLEWDPTNGATSYEIYELGERFMESVGTTEELFMDVPVDMMTNDHWFAIRALGEENFAGRRSIAINVINDQSNCARENDIGIKLAAPTDGRFYFCEGEEVLVSLLVKNNGNEDVTGFDLSYQIDGNPQVTQSFDAVLAPQEESLFTFDVGQTGLTPGNTYELTANLFFDLDTEDYNNTTTTNLEVIQQSIIPILNVVEDFSGPTFPPDGWTRNVSNDIWQWFSSDVVGSSGIVGTSAVFGNNFTINLGEEDKLNTDLIDLNGSEAPILSFDLSYSVLDFNWHDSFRVDLYTECGNVFHSTIFGASGDDLATSNNFPPESFEDWRNITVNLVDVKDEVIRLSFVNITQGGNSLYLDNVNIEDLSSPPVASVEHLNETCILNPITFANTSTGLVNQYEWDFGEGGTLASSNEEGPHNIIYFTSGIKVISLTVSNSFGSNTYTTEILIKETPKPSFDFSVFGAEVTFENTSEDCQFYLWDFGDGGIAFEENPVYSFDEIDLFTVVLTGSSFGCADVLFQRNVEILTSNEELDSDQEFKLYPNPNTGNFFVEVSNPNGEAFDMELLDLTGKKLNIWELPRNQSNIKFEVRENLHSGVYFVKISNELITSVRKVVIQ